jgi:dolichyl-phosphate beta-glucosyltransferase
VSLDRPELSVVIPAYNEAARLPPYLAAVRRYLEARYADRVEVIVVDDGSDDGLADILAREAATWPALRCVRHPINRGKGAAVRTGVLQTRGDRVLFADADGATPIDEESRLAAALRAGADAAVASRLVAAPGARRERRRVRGLLGRLFAALARRLLRLGVRDTQCGFKMFQGDLARRLFERVTETGYLFDLELLALAARSGCRIDEVPVTWHDVPGGHLSPAREFRRVAAALWRLRRRFGPAAPASGTDADGAGRDRGATQDDEAARRIETAEGRRF